jgi:hypothetical protein
MDLLTDSALKVNLFMTLFMAHRRTPGISCAENAIIIFSDKPHCDTVLPVRSLSFPGCPMFRP